MSTPKAKITTIKKNYLVKLITIIKQMESQIIIPIPNIQFPIMLPIPCPIPIKLKMIIIYPRNNMDRIHKPQIRENLSLCKIMIFILMGPVIKGKNKLRRILKGNNIYSQLNKK